MKYNHVIRRKTRKAPHVLITEEFEVGLFLALVVDCHHRVSAAKRGRAAGP